MQEYAAYQVHEIEIGGPQTPSKEHVLLNLQVFGREAKDDLRWQESGGRCRSATLWRVLGP